MQESPQIPRKQDKEIGEEKKVLSHTEELKKVERLKSKDNPAPATGTLKKSGKKQTLPHTW